MSSLGVGDRSLRKKPSHTRTRLPLPMDGDSDPDVPSFNPTYSMVSHTRTRMPVDFDYDSDEETAAGTIVNGGGSYIGDNSSTLSTRRRSRRGTLDSIHDRDRDRDWDRNRERDREMEKERARELDREREREQKRDRRRDHRDHDRSRPRSRDRGRDREERRRERELEIEREERIRERDLEIERERERKRAREFERHERERGGSSIADSHQPGALVAYTVPYPDDDFPLLVGSNYNHYQEDSVISPPPFHGPPPPLDPPVPQLHQEPAPYYQQLQKSPYYPPPMQSPYHQSPPPMQQPMPPYPQPHEVPQHEPFPPFHQQPQSPPFAPPVIQHHPPSGPSSIHSSHNTDYQDSHESVAGAPLHMPSSGDAPMSLEDRLKFLPDKYNVAPTVGQEEKAPPLPPRSPALSPRPPSQADSRSVSRVRDSEKSRDSSRVRERSRTREHSSRRSSSKYRDSSRPRESSRRRRSSTSASKSGELVLVKPADENAVYSSEDERGRKHHSHGHRLSVTAPSVEGRQRRTSAASTGRLSHSALLGNNLQHRRKGRSHSRSRSDFLHPTEKMSFLTIDTPAAQRSRRRHSSVSLIASSPMLEPYKGTWQQSSPMPSPILRNGPRQSEEPIPEFTLSGDRVSTPEPTRRARFHDPTDYTVRIAKAIKDEHKKPDTAPLIEILPSLTPDQVVELRKEYRKMVTVGADCRGVNVAKHIKSRLKDCEPNLAKACYVVALGPWAAEAYWANYWYHSDKNRRELLIESLMGRTNAEIREIKEAFRDKRYDNSLVRCMKAELKEDKFKKAVLTVLEEGRMDETDRHGNPLPIDFHLVDKDVSTLRKSILSPSSGETAMMKIIVTRSDPHLRVIMNEYEQSFKSNLMKDGLNKCGNLVGEVIAHILSGIINKPVRDAKLLNHAITTSSADIMRNDLLTSRLVRFHWDRLHFIDVKKAFYMRYKIELAEAVKDRTSGEYGQIMRELCISRVPDSVKTITRVSDLTRQYSEMEKKEREEKERKERDRSRTRLG